MQEVQLSYKNDLQSKASIFLLFNLFTDIYTLKTAPLNLKKLTYNSLKEC